MILTDSFELIPSGTLSFPRSKPVLLVFYPGDFTPTCTKQLCEYRDRSKDFEKIGVDLIGISPDSKESHAKFSQEMNFSFPLLADPEQKLIKALGMKHMGFIPLRGYALFHKDGTLLWKDNDALPIFYTKTEALLEKVKKYLS